MGSITCQKKRKKKFLTKNRPRTPCNIKSGSTIKIRVYDYLMSIPKSELVVGVALTEVNQVLGSPLTVSTRRVEPTTSKATVSKRVTMLTKSRSEEGAKTWVSQTLEHLLGDERTKKVSL